MSMISRVYPNFSTKQQEQDLQEAIGGIARNYPSIIEELLPYQPTPNGGAAINIGPVQQVLLSKFAARVTLGLHFHETNQIWNKHQSILVRVFSNADVAKGDVPRDLIESLGPVKTLEQGSFNVSPQFEYASADIEDTFVCFATYRFSVAHLAFIRTTEHQPESAVDHEFFPGFLKEADG